jgi:glycosyltransferase involved in cell wall biosynthesis
MVGSGDMEAKCIEQAARMGLSGKLLFSPFLRGKEVDRAYQMADLFVMPSVSEPFGIVALEAMRNGTPVLASKQSGAIEVSDNIERVDFWDTDLMAKKVLELVNDPEQLAAMREAGTRDLDHLTWKNSAGRLQEIYEEVRGGMQLPSFQPAHA